MRKQPGHFSLFPRGLGTRLDKLMSHDFLIFMHMGVGCKVEDGGKCGRDGLGEVIIIQTELTDSAL